MLVAWRLNRSDGIRRVAVLQWPFSNRHRAGSQVTEFVALDARNPTPTPVHATPTSIDGAPGASVNTQ